MTWSHIVTLTLTLLKKKKKDAFLCVLMKKKERNATKPVSFQLHCCVAQVTLLHEKDEKIEEF